MRIRMPFVYFASYVPFKRKRERGGLFLGHVEADVPEITSSEVEVVAQWTYPSNLLEAKGDPITRCVRYGGQLFMPAANNLLPELAASQLPWGDGTYRNVDMLQQVYEMLPHTKDWSELRRAMSNRSTLSPDPNSDGVVKESQFERDRQDTQDKADALMIIDGMVWKNVPHINFRLDYFPGMGYPAHLTVSSGANPLDGYAFRHPEEANKLPLRIRRFAVTRYEEMEPHLVGLSVDKRYESLEVFDPEAVAFNGRSDFIARLMQCAVHRDRGRLGGFDGDRIARWAFFRDAVAAHVADPLADIPEETVSQLVEYISEEVLAKDLGYVPELLEVIEKYSTTGRDHGSGPALGL